MEKHKRLIYGFLAGAIGAFVLFLFLKYILSIILPFLISYLVVSMVRPLIDKICTKTKASRGFVTIFVIFLSMIILITGMIFLTIEIANQMGSIFEQIIENMSKENNFLTKITDLITSLEEKIPIVSKFTNKSLNEMITEVATEGLKQFSISVTGKIATIIGALPQMILTVVVIFLSLFYFAKDYDKIGNKIVSSLPPHIAEKLPKIKNDIILVVSKFVKSYLLLMFFTFSLLFAGFLILGIKNSFVLALIVAVVDILPIFGVGTVLIPWAIILFINGQNGLGISILILFGIIYLVRQYAEPKIVSTQMEVHPLVTLFAMYAGLKLGGILGLIFAPLLVYIIKTVYEGIKKEKSVDNAL